MFYKTREMIIVPNETIVPLPEYRKELTTKEDRHGKPVKEFSDKYQLGLTFQNVGVEEGNYNGYMWSIAIAKLGHVAIQKDEDIIFYLPDTMTVNQYHYLKSHKKEFSIYKNNMSIVSIYMEDDKFQIKRFSKSNVGDDENLLDILDDLCIEKCNTKDSIVESHELKSR